MPKRAVPKLSRKYMTVDPGWKTGIAGWSVIYAEPLLIDLIKLESSMIKRKPSLEEKLAYMGMRFDAILSTFNPYQVFIEGVTLRTGSSVSHASFTKGDAIGLTYLVGIYTNIAMMHNATVKIIKPIDWKGQMSDTLVEKRIDKFYGANWIEDNITKKIGKTNKVHTSMAVGIGLDLKARL